MGKAGKRNPGVEKAALAGAIHSCVGYRPV